MKLRLNNLRTAVQADDTETDWLHEYLAFDNPEARFYKRHITDSKIRLFNLLTRSFPAGFTEMVTRAAPDQGFNVELFDARQRPISRDQNADLSWLRDYQLKGVQIAARKTRGILWLPTGSGKCLGLGTPILRYAGRVAPVEEVQVGDQLMGPDSKPRTVLSTTRGTDQLFRIVPIKGAPWVCNSVHMLTLKNTETKQLIDIPLNQYLQKSNWFKHLYKLVRSSTIEFQPHTNTLPLSPYFLGIWLGDGGKDWHKNGIRISKKDIEIFNAIQDEADRFDLTVRTDDTKSCPTHRIVSKRGRDGKPNPLKAVITKCVDDDFRIKQIYLTAPLRARLELLAGLLDTDGYLHNGSFEIVQKHKPLAESISFLARSVGLRALMGPKTVKNYGTYWRISISGDCAIIPTRIPRKQAQSRHQKKDVLCTGFSVEPIGAGDYAGFTLSGDGRFLLGDFTITHNTEVACGLAIAFPCRWLFLVHRAALMHQAAERFERRTGAPAGRIGEGVVQIERFTAATFQTLYASIKNVRANTKDPKVAHIMNLVTNTEGLIVDESHVLPANSFYRTVMRMKKAYWRIGISGTPLARGDRRSLMAIGALGPVIYRVKPEVLIARGLLARPDIRMVVAPATSNKPTYQGVYGEGIVRNTSRNNLIVGAANAAAKPALIFVKEIKHGKAILGRLERAGIQAEFVWGNTQTPSRMASVKRLIRGDIDVLICSVIFQEGVDIPELKSVIVAAAGKSVIATIQRIGRGMRMSANKGNTFEVWDFSDTGNRMLEKHARGRRAAYEREGYEVKVLQTIP